MLIDFRKMDEHSKNFNTGYKCKEPNKLKNTITEILKYARRNKLV